jgi:restriction system protein
LGKRRGFFAELNHQAQLAERRRQQQAQAANRAHASAQRAYEQAQRAAERAQMAAARATAAQQLEAQREAARLHVESRQAEVAELNAALSESLAEIDGLLAATLDVDDWVDLEQLRITSVDHPAFDPGELGRPVAPPPAPQYPPQPVWHEPPPPQGLSGAFGGRKKHEEARARAWAEYQERCQSLTEHANAAHAAYQRELARCKQLEDERVAKLAAARSRYDDECRQRETEAAEHNAHLDRLINELAFDVPWAIQEYVGIVLSNSVYPDCFPVEHDYRFELETRELTLTVRVPQPSSLPAVKEYRYVKARDEISASAMPKKEQKDRYASAVWQVALRTLHEVFEADRVGRIHSVALTVDTEHLDPATGRPAAVPLVIVGVARETFTGLDLAHVEQPATLAHLGAAMSRSPFDLVSADTSRGVRASRR